MRSPDVQDRALGAIIGLAVGDALGTTLEFSARDSRPWHTEMIGGGPFQLPPGVWTDDTSMALALADSLVEVGHLNERDLMERFVRWWRKGDYSPIGRCFDIGVTTAQALGRFERTGDPLAGSPASNSAGNGSLMRLAPVALRYLGDPERAAVVAQRQSATTHGALECMDACAFFAHLLIAAIEGTTKLELLAPKAWVGAPAVRGIAAGSWSAKSRSEIQSTGYIIHTLEAALWCVGQAAGFEEAIITAVNLGDDADTVGAVTGQLAGAIWGANSIPDRWTCDLAWRERLVEVAYRLIQDDPPDAPDR